MSTFSGSKPKFSQIREKFPDLLFGKDSVVKKTLLLILLLLTLPALCFSASAESPAPAASPAPASVLQELLSRAGSEGGDASLPRVIDRIHDPDACPDFAFSGEDDLLEIWFPPIRDQDAAIFLYQGQVWMLDCGDERARLDTVPLLKYLGIDHIDRLINTHPHHDHLNGLYSIDEAAPVGELLVCFPEGETAHMAAAMEYCKGNGIPVGTFGDEEILSMGDGLVTFTAWLKCSEDETLNNRSAAFMVGYGDASFLSLADIELPGQQQLADALDPEALKADILRYPHHGMQHMVSALYRAVDPDLVIVTNAPRLYEMKDASRFLDYRHASVAYTYRNSHVLHLTTDGTRWLCEELAFDPTPWLPAELPTELPTDLPAELPAEAE